MTAIPWWIVPVLFFARSRYQQEDNGSGLVTWIKYKKVFGKIYIIDEGEFIPPPVHFNCRCIAVPLEEE